MAILNVDSLLGCNSIPDFFQGTADVPSNPTKAIFHNSTAPTSWTKDTSHDNKALRIIGGSEGATLSPGGSDPFTSVFASKSHSSGSASLITAPVSSTNNVSIPLSSTTTGNTPTITSSPVTLATTQIAVHFHQFQTHTGGPVTNANNVAPQVSRILQVTTSRTSGGTTNTGGHTHSVSWPHTHDIIVGQHNHTISTGQHSHPSSSISSDFRITYVDVIISTKN
jgi:hypothetical protein